MWQRLYVAASFGICHVSPHCPSTQVDLTRESALGHLRPQDPQLLTSLLTDTRSRPQRSCLNLSSRLLMVQVPE